MFISCFSRFSRPDKFDESAVNINMSRTTHKPGFRDIRASATVQPYRGPVHLGVRTIFLLVAIPNVPKAAMLTLTPHRHHDITRYCFRVFRQKLRQKLPRSLGCLHIHAVRAVGILFLLDLTITAPVTTFIPDTFCQLILECARVDLSSLKLLHRPRCSPLELLFSRRKYPVVILRFLSGKP